jgi:rare lipoprotein A
MRADAQRALAGVIVLVLLSSCGGRDVKDSAPGRSVSIPDLPGDAIPRPEAHSRYGNGPDYEVFGKRYTVMPSGAGYSERGVASWYGQKFHGRLTSNRETYNMYAMTAAHKTLPLPTYVRVRNLRNNKSIVVRVNDRGPFVHNRIIDLSYAAALRLDMVTGGTGLVEITAITFDGPSGDHPTNRTSGPRLATENKIYVQVGAFGSRKNAERRSAALGAAHIGNVYILEDASVSPTLYRVRIGPIHDVIQYDVIVEELENIGITNPYLVATGK